MNILGLISQLIGIKTLRLTQSNRSKLKRRVGMERCLPVGRVGENGSSIGVLDHKKKTEKHKEENNQYTTFLPFKTEQKKWKGWEDAYS